MPIDFLTLYRNAQTQGIPLNNIYTQGPNGQFALNAWDTNTQKFMQAQGLDYLSALELADKHKADLTNAFGGNPVKDQYGNSLFHGATGFEWAKAGLGAAMGLYGIYQGNKQLKLAKDNFEEQKALSRANYAMQAKAYNNNLRNQQSGRSFGGMSGSAKRMLGEEYERRRANGSYR